MFNIPTWAKNHRALSWIIITVLHFMLVSIWAELGIRAQVSGFITEDYHYLLLASLFIFIIVLYPGQLAYKRWKRPNFIKTRMAADFSLLFISGLIVFTTFNQSARLSQISPQSTPAAIPVVLKEQDTGMVKGWKKIKKRKENRKWRKGIRKWVKKRVHKLWKEPGKNTTGKIILLVLLAGVLSLGIGLLSCSIACSGSSGLAIMVAILGAIGTITLVTTLLKNILPEESQSQRILYGVLIFLGGTLLWIGIAAVGSG